ncbi:transcription factor TCP19-like [Argentina anserina]|uniref:transcription factor TCP19-like n=1 Tax=Argentina anserina TaxID=57926 RepID=UPI0021762463|nr:transcription factor TCP19-like [Potentilla anserina]
MRAYSMLSVGGALKIPTSSLAKPNGEVSELPRKKRRHCCSSEFVDFEDLRSISSGLAPVSYGGGGGGLVPMWQFGSNVLAVPFFMFPNSGWAIPSESVSGQTIFDLQGRPLSNFPVTVLQSGVEGTCGGDVQATSGSISSGGGSCSTSLGASNSNAVTSSDTSATTAAPISHTQLRRDLSLDTWDKKELQFLGGLCGNSQAQ